MARYGGRLPSDEATLLSFKGIGAYTAGAIRSFAFGERAAILDTNVARVLFRVFVRRGDPKSHAMRKRLWAISGTLVPHKHVFDFNQALMDLGATVCVARKPRCPICPMRNACRSFPWREPGTAPGDAGRDAHTGRGRRDRTGRARFLVTRRQAGVHLAGSVGVPGRQGRRRRIARRRARARVGGGTDAAIRVGSLLLHTAHEYPDRTVALFFYQCELLGTPTPMIGQEMAWVARNALASLPFPPADDELIRMLTSS